ncbi:hypothetical protein CR513_33137, partial [Mucuna pruriens]
MNLMRAQIRESEEATMTQILHGLNREIQDVVEIQHYKNLSKLIHQAIKVEMQIRKGSASRKTYGGCSSWKGKEKEKDRARREKSPKKGSETSTSRKEFTPTLTLILPRANNIKCFKCLGKGHVASECPYRCVIIVKEDGGIGSENFAGEVNTSSESKSLSDGSHYKGNILVVGRLMNSQVREETKTETQRENIFHSRCLILGNLCSVVIDEGNSVNVASERLVKKLAFPTTVHPRLYRLQWLSEKGDLLVDKQAEVTFTLGKNRMLEEFQDDFPKDVPYRLPPLRGIEHHMNLTLGVILPNGAAYRTNLGGSKINSKIGTHTLNLRTNSIQKVEYDAYPESHNQEDKMEEATLTLEGPMTKGRLQKEPRGSASKGLAMLHSQEEAHKGCIVHHVSSCLQGNILIVDPRVAF